MVADRGRTLGDDGGDADDDDYDDDDRMIGRMMAR